VLQHQEKVTVTIGAAPDKKDLECRGFDGGGKTNDAAYVRPGAMAPGTAFPGPESYDEATTTYHLKHDVDSGLYQWLLDRVGLRLKAIRQPLDARKQAGFYTPHTYEGVFTGVSESDFDPDGNDPKTLTITFQPDTIT
jgi:hypothetical protein